MPTDAAKDSLIAQVSATLNVQPNEVLRVDLNKSGAGDVTVVAPAPFQFVQLLADRVRMPTNKEGTMTVAIGGQSAKVGFMADAKLKTMLPVAKFNFGQQFPAGTPIRVDVGIDIGSFIDIVVRTS